MQSKLVFPQSKTTWKFDGGERNSFIFGLQYPVEVLGGNVLNPALMLDVFTFLKT